MTKNATYINTHTGRLSRKRRRRHIHRRNPTREVYASTILACILLAGLTKVVAAKDVSHSHPTPVRPVGNKNNEDHDNESRCTDDVTYRSRLGLQCQEHIIPTSVDFMRESDKGNDSVNGLCNGYSKIGFSVDEVSELIRRCPQTCRVNSCDDATASLPADKVRPSTRSTNVAMDVNNDVESSQSLRTTSSSSVRKLQRSCFSGWPQSCQDDSEYRSKMRVPCWRHASLDCVSFSYVGYTDAEVLELVTSCPCSCQVKCGTFSVSPSFHPTAPPTTAPSSMPSAIHSSAPSALPTVEPTATFSLSPSNTHSHEPSVLSSTSPSSQYSSNPSAIPSSKPSKHLTSYPTQSDPPSSIPTVAPDIFVWSTTQSGIDNVTMGYGWNISNKGLSLSFVAEESKNCYDGTNLNEQKGTATTRIYVPEGQPIFLYYTLAGMGEQLDTGYEEMTVFVDSLRVASSTSNAIGVTCSIGPVSVTYEVEPPFILQPGIHTLRVYFTTFDDFDHYGVIYSVVFQPMRNSSKIKQ